jgi:hypothetical protein
MLRFMQHSIVQDIAVTLLLPTQPEHNSSLYTKICTDLAVTRKFIKLYRIHDLISPPLFNPVLSFGRLCAYFVEEDFVSENCKVLTENYSTKTLKINCFLLLKIKSF